MRRVEAQRGYALKLARRRTVESGRETPMHQYTPCRPNAVTRIPEPEAKQRFVQQINDQRLANASRGTNRDRQAKEFVATMAAEQEQQQHRPRTKSGRSRRSGKSVKSLSIQLHREKRKRKKLEAEVDNVRD